MEPGEKTRLIQLLKQDNFFVIKTTEQLRYRLMQSGWPQITREAIKWALLNLRGGPRAPEIKLEISDEKTKAEILHILRTEPKLAAHIMRGDRIASYICWAVGGPSIISLDAYLTALIENAVMYSAEESVHLFEQILASDFIDYRNISLLNVSVDKDIVLSSGIKIIKSATVLSETAMQYISFATPAHERSDVLAKSAILVDMRVSPRFVKFLDDEPSDRRKLYKNKINDNTFYTFDVDEFCQHWSMFSEHSVRDIVRWSQVESPEIFHKLSSGARYEMNVSHMSGLKSLSSDAELARDQYLKFKGLKDGIRQQLQVPMNYVIQSMNRLLIDGFISLGTALESFYLKKGEGGRGGYTIAIGMRAAWFLGKNSGERQELMRLYQAVSTCRNTAVHKGKFSDNKKEKAADTLRRGQELCRRGIRKVIADGKFPDWDKLVSGEIASSGDKTPDAAN